MNDKRLFFLKFQKIKKQNLSADLYIGTFFFSHLGIEPCKVLILF